jgi:hypothetical protein
MDVFRWKVFQKYQKCFNSTQADWESKTGLTCLDAINWLRI